MPRQVIDMIPRPLNIKDEGEEVEKEAEVEETSEEEKETPEEATDSEKPTEESAEVVQAEEVSGDANELAKQIQGLSQEREKLLKELQDLRGQRREIKQQEIQKVEGQLDELKDLYPEDIAVIERILRAKGYIPKNEIKQELYNTVKQQELDKFLEKYPEFKPENDQNDLNWNALQRELSFYRMPEDPHKITEILERARKSVNPAIGERDIQAIQKKQLKTAGVGGGGVQRSSASGRLTEQQKEIYRRGGWTEEEIIEIDKH